jgi:DNA primase
MPRYKALLIGASEYDDPAIQSLPFVWADLRRLKQSLRKRGFHSVTVAESRRGITPNFVDRQVNEFLWGAARGETLLIMLSGHGLHFSGSDYLVPEDAHLNASSIEKSCIKIDWSKELEDSAAGQVIFLIDACREGVESDKMTSPAIKQWSRRKVEASLRRKVAYVYACSRGQFALFVRETDESQQQHGAGIDPGESFSIFSRAVSDVANDPTISNLENFEGRVQQRIEQLHRGYNKAQFPQRVHVVSDISKREFTIFPPVASSPENPRSISTARPTVKSSSPTAGPNPKMGYAQYVTSASNRDVRNRLLEAHKFATRLFVEQLAKAEAEPARTYLEEHDFQNEAAIALREVGFSRASWDELVRHLRLNGFSDQEIVESGLAVKGKAGLYDRFRGRLMWPIRDFNGAVVGFGARRLHDDDNGPPYISSPDTAIYNKGETLYGIELAKHEIARTDRATIVSGYENVLACHLAGITDAVSPCGTANFGIGHVRILKSLLTRHASVHFVIDRDRDDGGESELLRIFNLDPEFASRSNVTFESSSYAQLWELRAHRGEGELKELLRSHSSLMNIILHNIQRDYQLEKGGGKRKVVDEAISLISKFRSLPELTESAVTLARLLEIPERELIMRARLAHANHSETSPPIHSAAQKQPVADARIASLNLRSPQHRSERELLKVALQFPSLVTPAFDAFETTEFSAAPYAAVHRCIQLAGGTAPERSEYRTRVREAAPNQRVRDLVDELLEEEIHTKNIDAEYAGFQLVTVRLRSVDRRIGELQIALASLTSEPPSAKVDSVQRELWTLQQYGQELRQRGFAAL